MLVTIERTPGVFDTVDDSLLVRTDGAKDTNTEHTTWVEYRFPDSPIIVHRSVHVTLKQGLEGIGALGIF